MTNPDVSVSPSVRENLRKRWLYLLPIVFISYSLAYLDRANYGFGAAAGLNETLHISGNQGAWLSGLFFLGYFTFQIPGTMLARKYSATRIIFIALITWGSLAALTGVIKNFWLLAADRFILGVAESMVMPTMLLLLSNWFTRAERSRANTVLILGNPVTVMWMSLITGFIIQAVGWQKAFIYEGLPSVIWAFVWIALVRDKPSQVSWVTPEAAAHLEAKLAAEQLTVAPVGAIKKALSRGDVWLLTVVYFFWSLGAYGFVLWLPTIIRQGGSLSIQTTGLLSALPYFVSVILMVVVSHFSDKTQKRSQFVWPFLLMGGLALGGSYLTAPHSFPLAFFFLVLGGAGMYAPYGIYFAIVPERVSRNVSAEVIALINSSGALGGFFGTYFIGFLQSLTGNSQASFLLMSLSVVFGAVLLLFLRRAPSQIPVAT